MAKNLTDGSNIVVEENGDNINLNLSSTYTNSLNQNITDSFKNNNIYSTSEKVVGKWIDNKPLYRKIISDSIGSEYYNTGLSGIGIVYIAKGFLVPSTGASIPINTQWSTGAYFRCYLTSESQLRVQNANWTGDFYIVLEYTKSSD